MSPDNIIEDAKNQFYDYILAHDKENFTDSEIQGKITIGSVIFTFSLNSVVNRYNKLFKKHYGDINVKIGVKSYHRDYSFNEFVVGKNKQDVRQAMYEYATAVYKKKELNDKTILDKLLSGMKLIPEDYIEMCKENNIDIQYETHVFCYFYYSTNVTVRLVDDKTYAYFILQEDKYKKYLSEKYD